MLFEHVVSEQGVGFDSESGNFSLKPQRKICRKPSSSLADNYLYLWLLSRN